MLIRKDIGKFSPLGIGMVTSLPGDGCNVLGAMVVVLTECVENAEILARITVRELKSVSINFNLVPLWVSMIIRRIP